MMNLVAHRPVAIALVCFVLGLTQISRAEDEWRASRTWIAGTDSSVWVVGAEEGSGESALSTLQMWQASVVKDKPIVPKQTRFLPAIAGNPRFLGADAGALRVMFADLSTWSYFSDRDGAPFLNWRECSYEAPLAWTGDVAEPAVWALAKTASLLPEKPAIPATQSTIATRPSFLLDDDDDASMPPDRPGADIPPETGDGHVDESTADQPIATNQAEPGEPITGLTLLHCYNNTWHRISVLKEAENGTAFWLAVRQGNVHLFWRDAADAIFSASWSRGTAWSTPSRIPVEGNLQAAWVGVCELGPVFIAGVGTDATPSSNSVQVSLYLREADGWSAPRRVSEGTEYLALDADASCAGVAANRLVVARPTADGKVQFGMADLGLSPSARFATLEMRKELSGDEMTWMEMIRLVLMLALMTLIFTSRREQMARLAIPPKGFVVASIWRRILATFLDLLPAAVVAGPIWMALYGERAMAMAMDWQALQQPNLEPADLICMQVFVLLIVFFYGVWCCAWELAIRSTPGKLIFGCRVVGMFGQRATTKQIVARNIMRVLVFSLGEPGLLITLMTMVLVSRNRQRLGDILADTIVIEAAPPAEDMQE